MKTMIFTECNSCGGTGLYIGEKREKGTAAICLCCGGSGEKIVIIQEGPVFKRKPRENIHTVYREGNLSKKIPYQKFKRGEMPPK